MANNRPKLEIAETPMKLKLLRDLPLIGENGRGKYFLYSVQDEHGQEFAWFAPDYIHELIAESHLKSGSEILVQTVNANGKKGSAKVQLSILGKAPNEAQPDQFREMMRQCIIDAMEIKKSIEGIDLTHEDLRSLSSCLFIARTKQY